MSSISDIRYLRNEQIDKSKWDRCLENSSNGLIYGYSFYLDAMSKNWDALVLNDYEAVMPLTWNKKYGIKYLYQPFLTAQLGVFGNRFNEEDVNHFIKSIPTSFRFIDISLNHNNNLNPSPNFSIQRNNYVLDLLASYEDLYHNYSENIQRNIKKAVQQGCNIKKEIEVDKIIELAEQQMIRNNHASKKNINRFRNLYTELQNRKLTSTYGVFSSENKLIASCVFFFSKSRAYYILVGNHPESKNTGASHALIDAFIKDHSGKEIQLDFEGSDIPGLANFYKNFGAVNESYPAIKINRLPFYLKWLKN